MNCKPNDLAVIVNVACGPLRDLIGTHVTTRQCVSMPTSGARGWTLDNPLSVTLTSAVENRDGVRYETGTKLTFDVVPDSWLQPIRGMPDPVHEIINDEAQRMNNLRWR